MKRVSRSRPFWKSQLPEGSQRVTDSMGKRVWMVPVGGRVKKFETIGDAVLGIEKKKNKKKKKQEQKTSDDSK